MIQSCDIHGVHLENSAAYTAQSNGAAERIILEHLNRTHTLLFACHSPNELGARPCIYLIGLEIDYLPKELRITSRFYYGMLPQELISVEYLNLEQKVSHMNIVVILRNFVRMEIDTQRCRLHIPSTNKLIVFQTDHLKMTQSEYVPGISALLDGISRQLQQEGTLKLQSNS